MKQRFALVLIFALVVSAAASVVLYRLIANQIGSKKDSGPTNQVLVATRTLSAGDLIKDGDVKMADWSGTPPPGSMTKVDDAVNRGVVDSIYQGEAVLETRVAGRGAGAGLAATIPPGMRAVAVRVNDVVGISGFATPGAHVDILISGTPPNGSAQGTVTKTLLQNIEILSAGQNIQKDAEGKPVTVPVVNLLATPEQAEIMSLAANDARIQLVLRNPMDKDEVKTSGTAMAYLFAGGTPPPPSAVSAAPRVVVKQPPPPPPPPPVQQVVAPKPPPAPITVEVFHGSRKTESKFSGEDAPEGKK